MLISLTTTYCYSAGVAAIAGRPIGIVVTPRAQAHACVALKALKEHLGGSDPAGIVVSYCPRTFTLTTQDILKMQHEGSCGQEVKSLIDRSERSGGPLECGLFVKPFLNNKGNLVFGWLPRGESTKVNGFCFAFEVDSHGYVVPYPKKKFWKEVVNAYGVINLFNLSVDQETLTWVSGQSANYIWPDTSFPCTLRCINNSEVWGIIPCPTYQALQAVLDQDKLIEAALKEFDTNKSKKIETPKKSAKNSAHAEAERREDRILAAIRSVSNAPSIAASLFLGNIVRNSFYYSKKLM